MSCSGSSTGTTGNDNQNNNNNGNQETSINQPYVVTNSFKVKGNHLVSDLKGNSLAIKTFDMAWDVVKKEKQLKGKLEFAGSHDKSTQSKLDFISKTTFPTSNLSKGDFITTFKTGSNADKEINKEVEAKFPKKSVPKLSVPCNKSTFIAYSYLYHKVAFGNQDKFKDETIDFKGKQVKGFCSKGYNSTIEVLDYTTDNGKCAIIMYDKERKKVLYLLKKYSIEEADEFIQKNKGKRGESLDDGDYVAIPNIAFKGRNNHDYLKGKGFKNTELAAYRIDQVFDDISFILDQTGAIMEAQTAIIMTKSAPPKSKKTIIFDDDFIIAGANHGKDPAYMIQIKNNYFMTPAK